jgi:hypothetical protein
MTSREAIFGMEITGKERWAPLEELLIFRDALTTRGEQMSFALPDGAASFAGIHVPSGETWYFRRTLLFRLEGRREQP